MKIYVKHLETLGDYAVYRTSPTDWDFLKTQLMQTHKSAFEPAVRETNQEIERYFVDQNQVSLVVEDRTGSIIAYATGGPLEDYFAFQDYDAHYGEEDSFYLASVCVKKNKQGQGVGKLLTNNMIDQIKKEQYDRISAHATNDTSVHLAEQYGFKKLKFLDTREWRGGRWAWYMALDLTKTQT